MRHRPLPRTGLLVLVALAALAALTACEPTPTKPGTQRVVVFGDSVPAWIFRDGAAGIDADEYTAINAAVLACDGVKDAPPVRGRDGKVLAVTDSCKKGWPSQYPPNLTLHTDVAVVMTSNHAMLDHQLDGTWRHPCHTPARTWYQNDMTARLNYLRTKADKVVVVLPAWPGPNAGWIMPADSTKRADCVRSVVRAAATAAGVTTVDFGAYLCPTGAASCNTWRSQDGMHVDPSKAATVMAWLLAQVAPPAPAAG